MNNPDINIDDGLGVIGRYVKGQIKHATHPDDIRAGREILTIINAIEAAIPEGLDVFVEFVGNEIDRLGLTQGSEIYEAAKLLNQIKTKGDD